MKNFFLLTMSSRTMKLEVFLKMRSTIQGATSTEQRQTLSNKTYAIDRAKTIHE